MRVVKVALPEGEVSGLPADCATAVTLYSVPGCRPGMRHVAGPVALTAQDGTPDKQLAGVAVSQTTSR